PSGQQWRRDRRPGLQAGSQVKSYSPPDQWSSKRICNGLDGPQNLVDRRSYFSLRRIPHVSKDSIGIDDEGASPHGPRERSLGAERHMILRGKLAPKIADQRIFDIEIFRPGAMR